MIFSRAETPIGGILRQISFVHSGNPYIVIQDLVIPKNVEVKIGEGCVFLFQPFTSIKVEGRLIVEGSRMNPAIFTSTYDTAYNAESRQLANPFDWNGIHLEEGCGAILKDFLLQYSVFGIKAVHRNITIRNGIFKKNGQCHLTIAEKQEVVIEGSPFTYIPEGSNEQYDNSLDEKPGAPVKAEQAKKKASPRIVARWSSFGAGIAAAGAGIGMTVAAVKAARDVAWIEQNQLDYIGRHGTDAYETEHQRRADAYKRMLVPAILLDALGAIGFTVTFATFLF